MISIPNFISIGRLLAAPLIVWLILDDHLGAAFWVFVAAGLSDAADGFLARRLNAASRVGEVLDPIADKMLLICIYVTLGIQELLWSWLVILVVSRDVLIIGAHLLASALGQKIAHTPLLIGKVNTAAQIALAALVLGAAGLAISTDNIVPWVAYLVGVTTIASGVVYLRRWIKSVPNIGELE
ncbi:MAG: CDP-alcohol phosphatidyltransferase family protein [Sphingomonadales bacterium]